MEQNQDAHGASAAGADAAAALPHWPGASWATAPAAAEAPPEDEHDFASEAEANAYWQGLADGIRQSGGIVPARLAARLKQEEAGLLVPIHGDEEVPPPTPPRNRGGESQPDSPPAFTGGALLSDSPPAFAGGAGGGSSSDSYSPSSTTHPTDTLAFTPANPRPRHDGWTPERQVAFVEALADCGIVRHAAAKVGMTEQSVANLRRRADARAFNRACDAAAGFGARRLRSIAYERAVEGTIKRHYFHGELKAEERVYDNRLLIALINKLPDTQAHDARAEAVADDWDGWMTAIATGRNEPAPPPPPEPKSFEGLVFDCGHGLLTNCPPPCEPDEFDGYQHDEPGDSGYQRELAEDELAWWQAEGRAAAVRREEPGYVEWKLGRSTFFPWGSERTTSSAAAAEPEGERSEASEPSGERRSGAADGSSPDEPDRRHGEVYPEPSRRAGTLEEAEPAAATPPSPPEPAPRQP